MSKKYGVILADPPWSYNTIFPKNGAASSHYSTMTDDEIIKLPIIDLALDDSVLLLWSTWPKLQNACIPSLCSWGFEYVTGFPWIKVDELKPSLFGGYQIKPTYGTGFWVRGCTEPILIGKRGNPRITEENFCGLLGEAIIHSKKPNDIYEYAESLDGPYLELFARRKREGWDSWGNEIESDIDMSINS